jgi:trehalose synthase
VAQLELVEIQPQPLDRYRGLLGDEFPRYEAIAEHAREAFAGRAIWHVNSTARGGGVAEILHALLPYVRGAGVDTRWVALDGGPEFFAVTKRLHNHLHEDSGDGGRLGEDERGLYERALGDEAARLRELVRPGDVVYLHDPQTAGLIPAMRERGTKVIWRCHVGVDRPGELARGGWDFLRPYVEFADAYVFSRGEYVWDGLERRKAWLMAPAIDAFSPKNRELEAATIEAVLRELGLDEEVPAGARLAIQVSRWDRLKDPGGLLECFASHVSEPDLHLALVGPASAAVADDPEGAAVYEEVAESWRQLPVQARDRIHLVSLPMEDLERNATMVNALQRRADVIVQKSLAEGFGLTVAEAMWKAKPVVATRLGGIQDQIVDGESGVLIDDPRDLAGFAAAISAIAADASYARRLGEAARERVRQRFLAVGRLSEYVEPVASLVDDSFR